MGCIPPLCELIGCADSKIVLVCLEALQAILRVGKKIKEAEGLPTNPFADLVDQADGTSALEKLQDTTHEAIFKKVYNIISTYFPYEEEDEGVAADMGAPGAPGRLQLRLISAAAAAAAATATAATAATAAGGAAATATATAVIAAAAIAAAATAAGAAEAAIRAAETAAAATTTTSAAAAAAIIGQSSRRELLFLRVEAPVFGAASWTRAPKMCVFVGCCSLYSSVTATHAAGAPPQISFISVDGTETTINSNSSSNSSSCSCCSSSSSNNTCC
ncbi:hypothetical protein ACSSS7_006595 [Eimeria intestinalis]